MLSELQFSNAFYRHNVLFFHRIFFMKRPITSTSDSSQRIVLAKALPLYISPLTATGSHTKGECWHYLVGRSLINCSQCLITGMSRSYLLVSYFIMVQLTGSFFREPNVPNYIWSGYKTTAFSDFHFFIRKTCPLNGSKFDLSRYQFFFQIGAIILNFNFSPFYNLDISCAVINSGYQQRLIQFFLPWYHNFYSRFVSPS